MTYKALEVLGPEHEFSVVDEDLHALSIVDKIMKGFHGRIVNEMRFPKFSVGKELQTHVLEFSSKKPFYSPKEFEETMQVAVSLVLEHLRSKYGAFLLGSGMHPLLNLPETGVWSHRHRSIYKAYEAVFNLRQHGWINIQSFQLNLSYGSKRTAPALHNVIAGMVPYIPAITASSPIYEGKLGEYVDNRLHFYKINEVEVPSLTGDVVPEYVESTEDYKENVIGKYSRDLAKLNVDKFILYKEWVNSRGIVLRFQRKAIEIRVIDEQECIKSDVAISCFIRAAMRGLMEAYNQTKELLPHDLLVKDFNSVIKDGLRAKVLHPKGPTALDVCKFLYRLASENASDEEKDYLPLIRRRMEEGNLSEAIAKKVKQKSQKTELREAILEIYLNIAKSLKDNTPYF
nr:glutamate-cysteine ligase family protein [Candidatus Njordarchaeum guaymaensis]